MDEAFAACLAGLVADQGLPGAVAAVRLDDGRSFAAAAGFADVDAGRAMTVESRFLGASVGKTFVSALALALAGEGRLDLDRPVSHWLGERAWFAGLPNAEALSVRVLLNHSSGIPDHLHMPEFRRTLGEGFAADPGFRISVERQIGFAVGKPPLFPAGHGYQYSDTEYLICGLVLEAIGGEAFYDQVQDRFIGPLGLTRTEPSVRRRLARLVNGYVTVDSWIPLTGPCTLRNGALLFSPASEWTGGGYVTNPQDLAAWASALYGGKAMAGSYLETLATPAPGAPRDLGMTMGAGVGIQPTPFGPAWGHGGTIPGYTTAMNYFPDLGLAIAIQTNAGAFQRLASQLALIDALGFARHSQ